MTTPLSGPGISPKICAKDLIAAVVVRACDSRLGAGLRAVVLTGSLARNEGTFVESDGAVALLGDADFYLVFRDGARLPSRDEVDQLTGEIVHVLGRNGVRAEVSLGVVTGSYFARMGRNIATYELRSSGEVLWGDAAVLSLLPSFDAKELSKEDAWRLLANRIVEQLETVDDIASAQAQYRTAKLCLDMATSYLVFVGRYRSSYRERMQSLLDLLEDSQGAAAPFPLRPFVDTLQACTRFKLDGGALSVNPWEFWSDAVNHARQLWLWELYMLTGEDADIPVAELMSRWMACPSVTSKLRGWASTARRSGWQCTVQEWRRWARMAQQASPRYWVYSVASTLLFSLPKILAADGRSVPRLDLARLLDELPLRPVAAPITWQAVARAITWNYRRLLEGTTA